MKDAPAMKNEAYMLSPDNYISQVKFELAREKWPGKVERHYTKSWNSINEKLLKHQNFGERLKFGKFISQNETNAIIGNCNTDEEKILAIYNYIKNNYKWDETYGVFTKSSLKEVFNNKSGNVADINLLLVLILQNAGIDAHPAVLSTRNHGLLDLINPSVDQMNYVVAYVKLNNTEILLDATEPYCQANMLPPRCINDKIRVISEKYSKWININNVISKKTVDAIISINENNTTANIKINNSGYAAYNFRNELSSQSNHKDYIAEFEKDNVGIKINDFIIENENDLSKNTICNFNNASIESIENLGEMIYFSPVILDKTTTNPFVLEKREFPIDYNYPIENTYNFTYNIPENFKLEEIPETEEFKLQSNSAEYSYIVDIKENLINVTIKYKINKRTILPNEYEELKDFYNKIIDKENKQFILKKI